MEENYEFYSLDNEGILEILVNKKYSSYFEESDKRYVIDTLLDVINTLDEEVYIEDITRLDAMAKSCQFDDILDYRRDVEKGFLNLGLASGYIANSFDEEMKVPSDFYIKQASEFFKNAEELLYYISENDKLMQRYGWNEEELEECCDSVRFFIGNMEIFNVILAEYTEILFSNQKEDAGKSVDYDSHTYYNETDESYPADRNESGSISFEELSEIVNREYQPIASNLRETKRFRDKIISDSVYMMLKALNKRDDNDKAADSIYSVCIALSPGNIRFTEKGSAAVEMAPKIFRNSTYRNLRLLVAGRLPDAVEYFDQCYAKVKHMHSAAAKAYKRRSQTNI